VASTTGRSVVSDRAQLIAGLASVLLGVAVIFVVPELRHCVNLVLHGEFTRLREYIQSLGAGGVALLLGLMVLHAIVFYPSEIATTTAGWVYGFWGGLAIAVVGWLLAAMLSFALGRALGGPLLRRLLGDRFGALEQAMERGGVSLLISGRLIPVVPFALLGYVAGATRVNPWRFAWTSVVGYLPLTVAVTYLGSQAQTFSAGDPLVWTFAAVLLALIVGQRVVRSRHARARRAAASGGLDLTPQNKHC